MNKRVKAFTIMEMVVAMLLAAIVISVAYTAYSIINRSYGTYHDKNEDMGVLIQLDKLLKKDFSNADTITKISDGFIIHTPKDTFGYRLDSGFVIRRSTIIDTFKVKAQDFNAFFERQPVSGGSAVSEENRIDEVSFTVLFHNEKIPYHYHKDYSSANLIERNQHAIN